MVKLKRCYLLVEILAEEQEVTTLVDQSSLYHALVDQVAHLHGDQGVGAVFGSLQVKVHDQSTNIAVLRISANEAHFITSSIPFVLSINSKMCVLQLITEGVSMRTIERFLVKRNLKSLYARLKWKSEDKKPFIRKCIRSVTGPRVAQIRM